MTGATSGTRTAYPSGAPDFSPDFCWGSSYSIFSFMYMLCGSLFVLLYFFFWPLCCLFFFDLRILITPLVYFNHCVVCSSSIYGFWLPPFDIFQLFFGIFVFLLSFHYFYCAFGNSKMITMLSCRKKNPTIQKSSCTFLNLKTKLNGEKKTGSKLQSKILKSKRRW